MAWLIMFNMLLNNLLRAKYALSEEITHLGMGVKYQFCNLCYNLSFPISPTLQEKTKNILYET